MEGLLGTQHQNIPYLLGAGVHVSRRMHRRRGDFVVLHHHVRLSTVWGSQFLVLGGTQEPAKSREPRKRPLSKLEQLKQVRFTALERKERIARSLAALQQTGAIQLSQEDWRWLDENAAIEDELE